MNSYLYGMAFTAFSDRPDPIIAPVAQPVRPHVGVEVQVMKAARWLLPGVGCLNRIPTCLGNSLDETPLSLIGEIIP